MDRTKATIELLDAPGVAETVTTGTIGSASQIDSTGSIPLDWGWSELMLPMYPLLGPVEQQSFFFVFKGPHQNHDKVNESPDAQSPESHDHKNSGADLANVEAMNSKNT